ncbi:MAG: DUF6482 family protein [Halioglobus sp.]
MKISFKELSALGILVPAVIHSLDQALYQVTVVIDGESVLLTDNSGVIFRRHSLEQTREALQVLPIESLTLQQQSAYDEMIGQPMREGANTLEVSLAVDTLADPVLH